MKVKIYRPAKSAMQSRCSCDGRWVVEPVLMLARDHDPLMGWTRAQDPLASLRGRLSFATSGEALTFVRQRGWDFEVIRPREKKVMPRSYTDNFNPDRRRIGR
ncbi:MAG: ETC complex I subunit [Alphaproteobacteria bacterium]|nr:ETC complex I subunit [Alphaproteobacteria bacterium]